MSKCPELCKMWIGGARSSFCRQVPLGVQININLHPQKFKSHFHHTVLWSPCDCF